MPKKSVTASVVGGGKAFGKKWQGFIAGIAERRKQSITAISTEAIEDIIETLNSSEAPWTYGTLTKQGPFSSRVRPRSKVAVRLSQQGFKRFRLQQKGKRTFVIRNAAWPIYGKKLEQGKVVHNPALGGRSWSPGFVSRSLALARTKARIKSRSSR